MKFTQQNFFINGQEEWHLPAILTIQTVEPWGPQNGTGLPVYELYGIIEAGWSEMPFSLKGVFDPKNNHWVDQTTHVSFGNTLGDLSYEHKLDEQVRAVVKPVKGATYKLPSVTLVPNLSVGGIYPAEGTKPAWCDAYLHFMGSSVGARCFIREDAKLTFGKLAPPSQAKLDRNPKNRIKDKTAALSALKKLVQANWPQILIDVPRGF